MLFLSIDLLVSFFRKSIFIALALLLLLQFTACDKKLSGDFGWATWNKRDTTVKNILIAKNLFQEEEFKIKRKHIHFSESQIIWWFYQITNAPLWTKKTLHAMLYKKNYSLENSIIDLRELYLHKGTKHPYARSSYEGLDSGHYILRINYDNKIIDNVEFFISPSPSIFKNE